MSSPILTISLLCPGRTEDVFKTLDSIKPILEKVPSELIIVDTGCPEEFRKRLEKYTDKIIPFTWTADFAEARNVGLDAAKGQWFMFIDDDEWFEDVKSIIEFFNSGEYKEYLNASYLQRNYRNFDGNEYTDAVVFRIFKLLPGHRFESKIHEYYNGPTKKICWLPAYVHHYGYVYDSEEKQMKHILRNIVPLRELVAEDNHNMHAHYELAQELRNLRNWEELARECRTAIDLNNAGDEVNPTHMSAFYIGQILAAINKYDMEGAYEAYREAMTFKGLSDVARARIYIYMIAVFEKLDKYDELKQCLFDYLKLYKKLAKDEMQLSIQECLFSDNPFDEPSYLCVRSHLMVLGVRFDDKDMYGENESKIEWQDFYANANSAVMVSDFVKLLATQNLSDSQLDMATQLVEKITGADTTQSLLEGDLEKKINEKVLLENISKIKSDIAYIKYLQSVDSYTNNDLETTSRYLTAAVAGGQDMFGFSDGIWDAFADGRLSISEVIDATPVRKFISFVTKSASVKDKDDRICDRLNLILDNLAENDTRFTWVLKCLIEYQLIYTPAEEFQGYEDIKDVFAYWSETTFKYYAPYYKPETFIEGTEILSDDCLAAIEINKFIMNADSDAKMALVALKEATKVYKRIGEPVKTLTGLYVKRIK